MTTDRRPLLIKITAAVVGLYLLDSFAIEPAIEGWKQQSARIEALRTKVERGRQLREREAQIRDRWAGMLRANLPAEVAAAESEAYQSISRWVNASQINLTGVTPQWQKRDDGSQTYECRLAATGNYAALGRFIYELESDPAIPVNLEECELVTRDPKGSQLTLTARITFLQLKDSNQP